MPEAIFLMCCLFPVYTTILKKNHNNPRGFIKVSCPGMSYVLSIGFRHETFPGLAARRWSSPAQGPPCVPSPRQGGNRSSGMLREEKLQERKEESSRNSIPFCASLHTSTEDREGKEQGRASKGPKATGGSPLRQEHKNIRT